MSKSLSDQTIALAGLLQAANLAHKLAHRGAADESELETTLASVLKINADTVEDVYNGVGNLSGTFRLLTSQLDKAPSVNPELARYVAALHVLSGKLMNNPAMSSQLRTGIEQAAALTAHYGVLHESVIEKMALLYQETISLLGPKIMVRGEPRYLTANATRIRAVLLAGIRAAVLWRQCGGSEWKLLFYRKKISAEALRLARL
jgi:high frequency lysogenization protein